MTLKHLFQFFGAWFHQDWIDEAGEADPDLPVANFLKGANSDSVQHVRDELAELLALNTNEEHLKKLLGDFGCEYLPEVDGLSYREWLLHVHALLATTK